MRKVARINITGRLAYLLCVVLAASLVSGGLLTTPATAQVVVTASGVEQHMPIAVVEFHDVTGSKFADLGGKATRAVSANLSDSGKFEPMDPSMVAEALTDLDLTLPLSHDAAARVGRKVEAQGVLIGEVRKAQVRSDGGAQFGEVTLAMQIISPNMAVPINGDLFTAYSSPKVGYKGEADVLIDEAIRLAAYQAVRHMVQYRQPSAAVLTPMADGRISLSKGLREGIDVGMAMMVTHLGDVVGRVEVTRSEPVHAEARLAGGAAGVSVGDKAWAIYQYPDSSGMTAGQRRVKKEGLGKQFISLLAGGVLFGLMSSSGGQDAAPTDCVASSLANIDDTIHSVTGANLITWGESGSAASAEILGYEIYRGTSLIAIIPAIGPRFYIDGIQPIGTMSVTITIRPEDGTIELWEEDFTAAAPAPSRQVAVPSITWVFTVTPPVPGEHYLYSVTRILARRVTVGPAAFSYSMEESQPSNQSGTATPIPIVALTAPVVGGVDVNPLAASFEWIATTGADQYVVQISTNSFFSAGSTITYPVATVGEVPLGTPMQQELDISTDFPLPVGQDVQTLFWRVGARWAADEWDPRAWPLDAANSGYVWSETRGFATAELPPPPPAPTRTGTPFPGVKLPF